MRISTAFIPLASPMPIHVSLHRVESSNKLIVIQNGFNFADNNFKEIKENVYIQIKISLRSTILKFSTFHVETEIVYEKGVNAMAAFALVPYIWISRGPTTSSFST